MASKPLNSVYIVQFRKKPEHFGVRANVDMVWPTLAHTVGTSSLSVLIRESRIYRRVHYSELSPRIDCT